MKDTKFLIELAIDKNNLDTLIHLVIDNSELNYNGKSLRIGNESTIVQFIKYLNPIAYENKLKELKKQNI